MIFLQAHGLLVYDFSELMRFNPSASMSTVASKRNNTLASQDLHKMMQGPLGGFHEDLFKISSQGPVKDFDQDLHARTPARISRSPYKNQMLLKRILQDLDARTSQEHPKNRFDTSVLEDRASYRSSLQGHQKYGICEIFTQDHARTS